MGPTASGKTALAIALRKVLPVELISVDSALIYRGMDIGTAKPDAAELSAAPHRLLDILDPAESYSAADFRRDASGGNGGYRRGGADPAAGGRYDVVLQGVAGRVVAAAVGGSRQYEPELSNKRQSKVGSHCIVNCRRSILLRQQGFIQMIHKGFPGHWKFFSFRVKL